jgi:hypothetical protein
MPSKPNRIFHENKKGQMALETIFKVLILLVAVAVIIGLIISFSDQVRNIVKEFINKYFGKNPTQEFPKQIEKDSFASGEIASYIESCYTSMTSIPEGDQKDTNCFLLIGKSFESSDILEKVSPSIRNNVEIKADFTRGILIIQFQDVGNKIIVR